MGFIKRIEEYSNIVSRISRYANTQNKVNDADFTAKDVYKRQCEKCVGHKTLAWR